MIPQTKSLYKVIVDQGESERIREMLCAKSGILKNMNCSNAVIDITTSQLAIKMWYIIVNNMEIAIINLIMGKQRTVQVGYSICLMFASLSLSISWLTDNYFRNEQSCADDLHQTHLQQCTKSQRYIHIGVCLWLSCSLPSKWCSTNVSLYSGLNDVETMVIKCLLSHVRCAPAFCAFLCQY